METSLVAILDTWSNRQVLKFISLLGAYFKDESKD